MSGSRGAASGCSGASGCAASVSAATGSRVRCARVRRARRLPSDRGGGPGRTSRRSTTRRAVPARAVPPPPAVRRAVAICRSVHAGAIVRPASTSASVATAHMARTRWRSSAMARRRRRRRTLRATIVLVTKNTGTSTMARPNAERTTHRVTVDHPPASLASASGGGSTSSLFVLSGAAMGGCWAAGVCACGGVQRLLAAGRLLLGHGIEGDPSLTDHFDLRPRQGEIRSQLDPVVELVRRARRSRSRPGR